MTSLISLRGIALDVHVSDPEQAIRYAGELLVDAGAVSQEYTSGMLGREKQFPTALGEGFAFPHGTQESHRHIFFDQVAFMRLRKEISWGDGQVKLIIAIAAKSQVHQVFLGNIANQIADGGLAQLLLEAANETEILNIFSDMDVS